jgi:hypothetical protein
MALSLVTTTINAAANDAYLDDSIVLEFNQDLKVNSVNTTSVLLFLLPDYNPFNADRQVDGKYLIVKASPGTLVRNSSYELVVVSGASGLLSTTDEQLVNNLVVPFQTKEKLKPTTPTTDPITTLSDYDIVAQPVGDDTTILIPDTRPQGEILPYVPCPPDELEAFLNDSPIINASGIITPLAAGAILKPVLSDPENYSVGITSLETITIYWPENIYIDDLSNVAKLSYQVLNYPMNPFTKTNVTITAINTISNQLIISTTGIPADITNYEFTLVINPLKIRNEDYSKKNVVEKFHFLGVLSPMLCTVEIAKGNAGLWMDEFTNRDYYEYSKIIHKYSTLYMSMSPHLDFANLTVDEETIFSKYVCCSTALDMLTSGTTTKPGSGLGANSSLFVKKRQLPGVTIEYGQSADGSLKDGTVGDPGKESLKRLLKCIEENKPKQERTHDKGPMAIRTGTKSLYDTSLSIPIRRRL